MRWPLRIQILLPLLTVVLATIVAVSLLNALWADQIARGQIERRLHDVASTLVSARFPLTESVLQQTRGLSGAELVVLRGDGLPPVASDMRLTVFELPSQLQPLDSFRLETPVTLGTEAYYHAAVRVDRGPTGGSEAVVHLLYPAAAWRTARREAIVPPLVVGGVALVVAAVLASLVAARVVRPIRQLQEQLGDIAGGNYRTLPLPATNDEIRDLAATINRLTEMLSLYETRIRGHERLRTLEQLGGGIAHQLRNAATGCRLALDLHGRECPLSAADENLSVARRQLRLMERYLQRFLARGPQAAIASETRELIELGPFAEDVAALVRPLAAHLKVALNVEHSREPLAVRGERDNLEQVLINLLVNAIEAATTSSGASVTIACLEEGDEHLRLEVRDSGPGPSALGEHVFEPFFTDKPDGTGLGLAVAREIVVAHGGQIRWERRGDQTVFIVELPRAVHVATVQV